MHLVPFLAYAALGLGAGLLIGCVGIGGVILVPALVYVAGLSVQTAIAAAMCAFLVSGIVGMYVFAKAGSVRWEMTRWLWLGAVPSAFAGALLVNAVTPAFIELAIGALTAASGAYALASEGHVGARGTHAQPAPRLSWIGALTGFTSALTGTGGPLVLVPILVWLEMPVLVSVGLGQAIQLPIAAAATGGNWWAGTLDIGLAAALACGIALGTWAGAKAAHRLPTAALRRLVASLLLIVGASILLRLLTVHVSA
jgi:hypothetical protein